MLISDVNCTREIKASIVMEKAAFNKTKTLFTSEMGLKLK